MALSPAAADKLKAQDAKPVEFKVSFWQLAFYGEIGFVGIWFFLMLAMTLGPILTQWVADLENQDSPTLSAEEANRHSVVARKVVDLLNAGDYAALQKLYNPGMSKAFPPQKTSAFYTRLAKQFGKIENFDGPTGKGYRGWIAFRLHCQRGELLMSLALDAEDKIAGIYFRPAPSPSTNNQPFVQRLFSWLHLALLVPFVLAGLLNAWLSQKWTERAVGISTLGVHLHQGQFLMLWDEIKEIRLVKTMSIRSLWLIRESGEKTLLPWTGLERHSDLRAAVERFAPANHPIRQHLPLLR
jgi:hypothetical protein